MRTSQQEVTNSFTFLITGPPSLIRHNPFSENVAD